MATAKKLHSPIPLYPDIVSINKIHGFSAHFKPCTHFSSVIQMQWKTCFGLISILNQYLVQNFVHDMAVLLLKHVQKL